MFNLNRNKMKGGVSTMLLGLILGGIVLLGAVVFVAAQYIQYKNMGVTMENDIKAQYESNQNNLGQLTLKVKESLGVAKLNNAELERVLRSAVEGRYGDAGAQQAILFVTENYPGAYDPSMMKNVQQTITAGRTDFEAKQNLLIDKVRVYRNQTEYVWSGFWLGLAGYPKLNFDTYKPILASDTAQKFETKVDEGFDIQ